MRKQLKFLTLFFICLLFASVYVELANAASLYEYYNTGGTAYNDIRGALWVGQTFTVNSTGHTITSVKLKLFRVGSPGTLTIGVKGADGSGHPTGSDLTSGTMNGNSVTNSTSGAWYEISLTEYTLSASTKYAIVARATGGNGVNKLDWFYKSSSSYSDGNFEYSTNSGSTWTADSTSDFMFEVWGNPVSSGTNKTITGSAELLYSSTKSGSSWSFNNFGSASVSFLDAGSAGFGKALSYGGSSAFAVLSGSLHSFAVALGKAEGFGLSTGAGRLFGFGLGGAGVVGFLFGDLHGVGVSLASAAAIVYSAVGSIGYSLLHVLTLFGGAALSLAADGLAGLYSLGHLLFLFGQGGYEFMSAASVGVVGMVKTLLYLFGDGLMDWLSGWVGTGPFPGGATGYSNDEWLVVGGVVGSMMVVCIGLAMFVVYRRNNEA